MNPLTNTRNINKLNENELKAGIFDHKISWHADYAHSAYIFIGGFPFELTEGDIICVFSQYGEIVNIHLVRDFKTGKSKGYCFLAYEDQRSTILAVDNLNGIKLGGRIIRVDHVSDFKPPKSGEKDKFGNKLLLTPINILHGKPKVIENDSKNEDHSKSDTFKSKSHKNYNDFKRKKHDY